MFELPLFPLNTVLFPGMPLSLHIFEERYKLMMNQCIDEKSPFGVILIKEGRAEGGPLAKTYDVGCTAAITQVQRLPQDRMNMIAVGADRFRLLELDKSRPYLVGQVELVEMQPSEPEQLHTIASTLRPHILRYLKMLAEAGDVDFNAQQLPTDPEALASLGAYLLRIPMEQKQELLSLDSLMAFSHEVRSLYRREIILLDAMLKQPESETKNAGPFSIN